MAIGCLDLQTETNVVAAIDTILLSIIDGRTTAEDGKRLLELIAARREVAKAADEAERRESRSADFVTNTPAIEDFREELKRFNVR